MAQSAGLFPTDRKLLQLKNKNDATTCHLPSFSLPPFILLARVLQSKQGLYVSIGGSDKATKTLSTQLLCIESKGKLGEQLSAKSQITHQPGLSYPEYLCPC